MNLNTAVRSLHSVDAEAADLLRQAMNYPHSQPDEVQVVAMGLYNAGKSMLLNALADCIETEYFKTAAARETRELKVKQLEGYTLTDTPGIDADTDDDATAFQGILHSDLLLMVHDLTLGDLDAPTLEYLTAIRQHSQQPLHERLICVLTHAEGQSEADASVIETVLEQLAQVTGGRPAHFLVGSRSYLKGRAQGKLRLAEVSGIPALRNFIEQRVGEVRHQLGEIREQKRQQLLMQAQERVLAVMRERELLRKKIVGRLCQRLDAASGEISQIKQRVRAALEA